MSKPLLVILSPGFPANESDTTCLPLQQSLVLTINKMFPEIEIAVIAFQYPFTREHYRWHNNRVIPLNGQNKRGLARKRTGLRAWQALREVTTGRSVRGILSFWLSECAVVGNLFARKHGIKHKVWLLGQDARPANKYAQLLKKHPDQLVALSDFLVAEFDRNYQVMPEYVNTPGIDASCYTMATEERAIDILGVGSLIPLKQFNVLIDVIKKLLPDFPSLKAVICGDGSEKKRLIESIKENGLQQHIELIGEKKHEEVLALMQRSKLLLHPSSYEGFGMVCLEALYAGAHVISFCRPQEAWIRHWHYAADTAEMISLAKELLNTRQLDQDPVLPYRIEVTAREFIRLFHS
jgi:glycosyltransferase involved in cell wall biosynthesis